jgi:hypothetical protein
MMFISWLRAGWKDVNVFEEVQRLRHILRD